MFAAALLSSFLVSVAALATTNENRRGTKIPPPPPLSLPVWSLAVSTLGLQQQNANNDHNNASSSRQQQQQLPSTSMNIVTFCCAVSVASPKLWIVSLYYDTLTKDSFLAAAPDKDDANIAVLQLLRPAHKALVPVLGKQSGYDPAYSKQEECAQRGFPWVANAVVVDDKQQPARTLHVLPDCATYICLTLVDTMPAGDHLVALCKVVQTGRWDAARNSLVLVDEDDALSSRQEALDPSTVLYTGQLREENII